MCTCTKNCDYICIHVWLKIHVHFLPHLLIIFSCCTCIFLHTFLVFFLRVHIHALGNLLWPTCLIFYWNFFIRIICSKKFKFALFIFYSYRLCELLYGRRRQYGKVLSCYFRDPQRRVSPCRHVTCHMTPLFIYSIKHSVIYIS